MTKSDFNDYGNEEAYIKHLLIREWQDRTDGLIDELNGNDERKFELYIVNSEKFQSAVESTRLKLGINIVSKADLDGLSEIEKNNIGLWADDNIVVDELPSSSSAAIYFYQVINDAIDGIKLPRTWRNIFAYYAITNDVPTSSMISSSRKLIQVKNIDEDSITLRLSKGIRYEEFTKLWLIVTLYLGPGRRKTKSPDAETRIRDLQMYGKKQRGYKNSEIAKEYFASDINDATDAVKKAIRRQRKLFDKGTDLAD